MAQSKKRRTIITYLVAIIGFYLLYCGLLYASQTSMIFPAALAGSAAPATPTGVERIEIELTDEDGQAYAWFAPASNASPSNPTPLVVFFHGNAELIHHQDGIIDLYHQLGISVLLPEYRGYGGTPGTPSEATIIADALRFIDGATARPEIDATQLIIHGRSIGGMAAAQVALQRPPQSLILESAGRSVLSKSRKYLIPDALVTSHFRTDRAISKIECPILLFHGKQDNIFPHDDAIYLSGLNENTTLTLFNCGHNNLPPAGAAPEYLEAIRDLFKQQKTSLQK